MCVLILGESGQGPCVRTHAYINMSKKTKTHSRKEAPLLLEEIRGQQPDAAAAGEGESAALGDGRV